jgi:hypothetical protein
MSRSVFFCPPFSAVFAVFALLIPLRSIPAAHTAKHCLTRQEPSRLNYSIPQVPFHSFGVPALALPAKKTSLHGKKRASPACST